MVDRKNLVDFFTETLDGIGYGKLSKTNRAYNWMKNNHSLEGPCLDFLKQNVTAENLVTVKELNLFTELQKGGNLPSETELDEMLAGYLTDESVYLQNMPLRARHVEASHASKYCEMLDLEEKTLKQQCHKLQNEIRILESEHDMNPEKEDSILTSATKINTAYNNLSADVQCKLLKISQSLPTILHNNNAAEERNLFHMNLDTFRKINTTFRESVDRAMRNRFNKGKKCESGQRNQIMDGNQAKTLISVAQSLGQYEYQRLKLQCEENELVELDDYIENVLKKSDFSNINCVHLKSLTDTNMKSTYQIQKKIMSLAEILEKFHSDYVVGKMLMAYRKQLEHRMKSDCKFLKRVSKICVDFVDLMTLQACLFHEKKENIDTIVAVCVRGRQTLEDHAKKHLMAVTKLKKMFEDQELCETSSRSSRFSTDSRISNSTVIVPENGSLVASDDRDRLSTLQAKILSFVGDYLSNYFTIREQLHELHKIMFSGPVRQIFFYSDVHNDESLVKQEFDQFNNQYKLWRSQYHKIVEKTNVTSYDHLKKTLGLMFLTDPTALRRNIEQLKSTILQNRSKHARTLAVAPVDSSTSQLKVKQGNMSSAI